VIFSHLKSSTRLPKHSSNKSVGGSIFFIVLCICLLGNINKVFAQTITDDETESVTESATEYNEYENSAWDFGMGVSYFSLDQEHADEQLIGDTAFSVDLYASYYFSQRLAASAGIGFLQLDDNNKFTELVEVTDLFGTDIETATSEARGLHYYGEFLFIATNASSPVQFKAGLGFGSVAGANRSIDNCSNCTEIDIDLTGGAYATASVYTGIADGKYNTGLSAKQYFGGDIKNTATLWFELNY